VAETGIKAIVFRFAKRETPTSIASMFLRNETSAKFVFVSYVSIFLCFNFDPIEKYARRSARSEKRAPTD
jgi:hypothetical protein